MALSNYVHPKNPNIKYYMQDWVIHRADSNEDMIFALVTYEDKYIESPMNTIYWNVLCKTSRCQLLLVLKKM